eukprot:s69_g5.t1
MASTLTNFRLGVLCEALELQRPCLVLLNANEPEPEESCIRARVAPNKESLKDIAERLQEVLLAAQEAASQSYDVDPGESSDEEGGSSEGIRLRVRLQRCSDDKWGIKWHKQMFKSSHRLVVDEIAPGSPLDRWNASQPQGLQVKYGDRLERLNGIRVQSSPAEVAGKFRSELQKEEMRALFWRPGQAKKPDAVTAPRVLVAASEGCGGLATAAAAVAAHLVLYSKATVTSAVQLVGAVAEPWLHCLEEMAPTSELEQPLEAPKQVEEGGCGLEASPAFEEKDVEDRQVEEAPLEEAEEQAAHTERIPQWTYRCRKCGVSLFHDLDVLPHQKGGQRQAGYGDWRSDAVAAAAAGDDINCTSMFVQPMKWMGDITAQTGRLICGNGSCKQKLGGFSWHGLPCSCGEWQSPAFQIHNARLDCMPADRPARGPVPEAVFDEQKRILGLHCARKIPPKAGKHDHLGFAKNPTEQMSAMEGAMEGAIPISAAGQILLRNIHPELYSDVGLLLLFLGIVVGLHFLYYEVAMLRKPFNRPIYMQLFLAFVASFFSGLGLFFLYAWAGLYS